MSTGASFDLRADGSLDIATVAGHFARLTLPETYRLFRFLIDREEQIERCLAQSPHDQIDHSLVSHRNQSSSSH